MKLLIEIKDVPDGSEFCGSCDANYGETFGCSMFHELKGRWVKLRYDSNAGQHRRCPQCRAAERKAVALIQEAKERVKE